MAIAVDRLELVWLELTGRCNLRCLHCYASSGPDGDHGSMTTNDWHRVINQAADLGVREVQFIGGEPTLHPALIELARHALRLGLGVEVYSNLARPFHPELWALLQTPGVRLATSYYAADARVHEAITAGRPGSHQRTRSNIIEALRLGIPLRVGLIEVDASQDIGAAKAELEALGVEEINVDRLRRIGRGDRDGAAGVGELCGHCADGRLAITPSGAVLPCPMARFLVVGNVHTTRLAAVNESAHSTREMLLREFRARTIQPVGDEPFFKCSPDDGDPCGGPLCTPHISCGPDEKK